MRPISRLNQHVIEESMQIVSSLKCGWQQGRVHSLFINMLPFRKLRRIIIMLSIHVKLIQSGRKKETVTRVVLEHRPGIMTCCKQEQHKFNPKKERSWRRGRCWIKRSMWSACERKHLHWSCSLCKYINVRQNQPWWETTTAHTMFTTCVILIHYK